MPATAPVAFVPRNRPEAIAGLLAFLAEGRSVRMIYSFQAAERIAASLVQPGVAAVVLHADDLADAITACAAAQGLALVVLERGGSARLHTAGRTAVAAGIAAQAPRIEILTSGTTGPPKHFPVPYSLIEQHFVSTPLTRAQGDDPAAAPAVPALLPAGQHHRALFDPAHAAARTARRAA